MSMTDLERAQLRTWAQGRLEIGLHEGHEGDALLPLALKALDDLENFMGVKPLTYTYSYEHLVEATEPK